MGGMIWVPLDKKWNNSSYMRVNVSYEGAIPSTGIRCCSSPENKSNTQL